MSMETRGYTVVPDWILGLELDIYETIILAVIYGFSQDGASTFSGSQAYLARKAKCSKRKVATALPHLVELGFLEKIDNDICGVKFCEYRVCTTCMGYAPHAGGYAPDAHNNIVNNIDKEREYKGSRFSKPTLEEVAAYCRERANGINPEEFFAFYESKGWKIGTAPMKDWKAAVRTWELKRKKELTSPVPAQRKKVSTTERNLALLAKINGNNGNF